MEREFVNVSKNTYENLLNAQLKLTAIENCINENCVLDKNGKSISIYDNFDLIRDLMRVIEYIDQDFYKRMIEEKSKEESSNE